MDNPFLETLGGTNLSSLIRFPYSTKGFGTLLAP